VQAFLKSIQKVRGVAISLDHIDLISFLWYYFIMTNIGETPDQPNVGVFTYDALQELRQEFWAEDPTQSWDPYIALAESEFERGVSAVILSGAHGVGKTSLFASRLNGVIPEEGSLNRLPITDLEGLRKRHSQVIRIDEINKSDFQRPDSEPSLSRLAETMKELTQQGKHFSLVIPHVHSHERKQIAVELAGLLSDHGITYTYLGDVGPTGLAVERVRNFFEQLGIHPKTTDLFSQLEILRNLRVFTTFFTVFEEMLEGKTDGMLITPPFIAQQLDYLIQGEKSNKLKINPASLTLNHSGIKFGGTPPHVPFLARSVSTAACVELYQALNVPLPSQDSLPTELGVDPYNKD
jgi:hypothetical protein